MKRTPEQVVWDFVHDWLRKAEGDLRAAEHLLESVAANSLMALNKVFKKERDFGAKKNRSLQIMARLVRIAKTKETNKSVAVTYHY